jgi:hypothetical protein
MRTPQLFLLSLLLASTSVVSVAAEMASTSVTKAEPADNAPTLTPAIPPARPSEIVAENGQSTVVNSFGEGSLDVDRVVVELRAELNEMKRSEDRLLTTVHLSLGMVVTVLAIIVGLNWFTNVRIYERERDAFEQKVDKNIRALIANMGS